MFSVRRGGSVISFQIISYLSSNLPGEARPRDCNPTTSPVKSCFSTCPVKSCFLLFHGILQPSIPHHYREFTNSPKLITRRLFSLLKSRCSKSLDLCIFLNCFILSLFQQSFRASLFRSP